MAPETKYRICPLCEAICGLSIEVDGRKVTQIRGDAEDAFSEGYICPKGVALQDLDADPDRLRDGMAARRDGFVLIGRRHLRSNNSWMHNAPRLVTGKPRCTAQLNARDAARLGIANGAPVTIASRVGAVTLPAEITGDIMPGVVSIPHGWGHDHPGTRIATAQAHAGVNSNLLADETLLDVPSGNAVLCGIPVTVVKATAGDSEAWERMAMAK